VVAGILTNGLAVEADGLLEVFLFELLVSLLLET
jgi:hypothetical protein